MKGGLSLGGLYLCFVVALPFEGGWWKLCSICIRLRLNICVRESKHASLGDCVIVGMFCFILSWCFDKYVRACNLAVSSDVGLSIAC